MLFLHILSFIFAFVLDLLLGDPRWLYHPVRLIGKIISFYEGIFLGKKDKPKCLGSKKKRFLGFLQVILVIFTWETLILGILYISYVLSCKYSFVIWVIVESFMGYQLLATKDLKVESMKVYAKLKSGNLTEARKALSMIVGRDTQNLNEEEITKACVETVAENTCDGVIAPMLFLALGGPALGYLYKCVNTMDSMIAYKNERYIDFGRFSAKTDDFFNYLPARISAILMILSTIFLGKNYRTKNAWKIYRRDCGKHASPNAGHTESVCAGALGVKLAGPAYYEGLLEEKEYIGDNLRLIEIKDIKRVNCLLYYTAFLCVIFCLSLMLLMYFISK